MPLANPVASCTGLLEAVSFGIAPGLPDIRDPPAPPSRALSASRGYIRPWTCRLDLSALGRLGSLPPAATRSPTQAPGGGRPSDSSPPSAASGSPWGGRAPPAHQEHRCSRPSAWHTFTLQASPGRVLQQMSQGSRKGAPCGECGKRMVVRVCQQICLCDLVDHRCWHAHRPPRRRQSEPTDSPLCVCVHKDARTRHHNSCKVGPRHCWQDVKGAQHATVCHCHPSPTMGRPTGNLMCSPPANLPAPRAPHAITLDSRGLCNRAPRPDRGPGHRRRAPV